MRILLRIIFVLAFLGILVAIISYAKGYRFDLKNQSVTPTGIISVNTAPTAAKIYVDEILKGVTNQNLTMEPGQYKVEIKKEGYSQWSKTVNLKGELVLTLDAVLFPVNPSLSPLTNLGVVKAISVGQSELILLFADNNDPLKDGIYLFDSSRKPLAFLPPLKLIALKSSIPLDDVDFTNPVIHFSPEFDQAVIEFSQVGQSTQIKSAYLLSFDEENKNISNIATSKKVLLDAWETQRQEEVAKVIETFPDGISTVASDSFKIISFSPDKTKMLYTPKVSLQLPPIITPPLIGSNQTIESRDIRPGKIYVYDKKEDKNFEIHVPYKEPPITNEPEPTVAATVGDLSNAARQEAENFISWYPNSKNLVINEALEIPPSTANDKTKLVKKITIADYDGLNRQTVYSGPFEGTFFTVTQDGKLVVLANLNPGTNSNPDLYLVGIR